jgi:hypothetical protein
MRWIPVGSGRYSKGDPLAWQLRKTTGATMTWLIYLLGILLVVVVGLAVWRALDHRADQMAWERLIAGQAVQTRTFNASMTAGLPEPARRYLNFTIAQGTPLCTAVEIDMTGEIGLGSKDAPGYRDMAARQILAPPHGLVWKVKTGPIGGSDSALPDKSWTRLWLFGLIPIVRASGPDHHRSAFGRVVAEGAFWTPASLLPGEFVRWKPIDDNSARAVVTFGHFEQAVDVTVDEAGAPTMVVIRRWSNANPEQVYREQPFGGYLSGFREFGGYRLPTRVEGGNLIGTPDYFPFFKAEVSAIRFPRRVDP